MKFITLKCPNCGGKLKTEDSKEQAVCIHCGYEFLVEKEQPTIHNHYYGASSPATKHPSVLAGAPRKLGANAQGSLVVFTILIVAIILLFSFLRVNRAPEGATDVDPVAVLTPRTVPQSEPMQLFVEYLFDKSYLLLTEEDYSQLKYLKVGYEKIESDSWEFFYSFSDYKATEDFSNTIESVSIDHEGEIQREDFQIFTGLTSLSIEVFTSFDGDYKSPLLVSSLALTSLDAFNTMPLSDTPLLVEDVSQLEHLSVQLYTNADVEEVLRYTNLRSLRIETLQPEVTNIGELSKLKHLTTLDQNAGHDIKWVSVLPSIKDVRIYAHEVSDYSALYGMPLVEHLTLDNAYNLKNIDFVKNMPNLKSLSLSSSKVLSLEPLEGVKSLQVLRLWGNLEIATLPELGTVTSLQEVEIVNSGLLSDDISSLAHLKTLTLSSKNIPAVGALTSMRNLTVWMDGDMDFSLLPSRFPGLKALQIEAFSAKYESNLSAIAELKQLLELRINNLYVHDSASARYLFTHPTLEHLVLGDMQLRLDGNFSENTVLKSLSISSELDFYGDETASSAEFGDFPSLLESFPAMEELSLSGLKISSVDFVETMPNLRVLDLENNYITDISPLTKLDKLETVLLQNNTIANVELLEGDTHLLTGQLRK